MRLNPPHRLTSSSSEQEIIEVLEYLKGALERGMDEENADEVAAGQATNCVFALPICEELPDTSSTDQIQLNYPVETYDLSVLTGALWNKHSSAMDIEIDAGETFYNASTAQGHHDIYYPDEGAASIPNGNFGQDGIFMDAAPVFDSVEVIVNTSAAQDKLVGMILGVTRTI